MFSIFSRQLYLEIIRVAFPAGCRRDKDTVTNCGHIFYDVICT